MELCSFALALIREAASLLDELFCYQESDLLRLQLLVTESRRTDQGDGSGSPRRTIIMTSAKRSNARLASRRLDSPSDTA